MGIFSNKVIDLSSFKNQEILGLIDRGEVTASTSWLGSRRVQIAKKEGSVSYTVFAAKLHEILKDIDTPSLTDRLFNRDRIQLVQSFHSSTIRKVVNLLVQLLFITRIFGYNQSLRDLQSDKNGFSRVTKDIWGTYFSGCIESKVTIDGTEYYQVSDRDLARAAIREQQQSAQSLQSNLEAGNSVIQNLQRNLEAGNDKVAELESGSALKGIAIQNLQRNLEAGNSEIQNLHRNLEARDDEIQNLHRNLEAGSSEIQNLRRNRLQKDKVKQGGPQRLIDELEAKISAKSSKIEELTQAKKILQGSLDRVNQENQEKEAKLKEKEIELQSVKKRLKHAKSASSKEIRRLTDQLNEASTSLFEFQKEKERWREEKENLIFRRNEISDELSHLKNNRTAPA